MTVLISVNGGTAGVKASVSASTAWTATLDSTAGVRSTVWSVSSTDETSAAASYTLVQSGSVGQTVASTSLAAGTALLLEAVINGGTDPVTGLADPANTRAAVKIYVPLADGGEVGCAGEEYESSATYGSTGIINSAIRKAALLSPSGVPVKIVRAATAAALPSNTRTGNVLTASANGAIGTIGGVALAVGNRFLVQNEGGGASHVNNGPYTLTTAGSGSTPWTATRTTDFDDSAELIAMTTFRVQEGTYAGRERYLVTSGATINVTALEFAAFAYAPNSAQFLCLTANADLSAETALDAIATTIPFISTTTTPVSLTRTDVATAAAVNLATCIASSSGTTAAGFGSCVTFQAKQGSGSTETTGRMDVVWTNVASASESSKFVFRTRVAGAAVTAGDHPELSAGGSSLPVTAASAGSKVQALTVRRRTGGAGATNDGGYISFTIPDSASTETEAARLGWSWQTVTGTYGEVTLGVRNNLGLGSQYTFDSGGKFGATNLNASSLSTAGLVTNSAAGLLSTSATAVLVNGTVPANLTAGVNIQNFADALTFSRTEATTDEVKPVLYITRAVTGAPGDINVGGQIVFTTTDAAEDNTAEAASFLWRLTNVTGGSHSSEVAIQIATAGFLTDALVLSDAETQIAADVTKWVVGRSAPYSGADATGAVTLDFSRSNVIEVSALVDNVTFTITGAVRGANYTVIVRQHASSAKTTTWTNGLFASGDDAIGSTVQTYTAWQFVILDAGTIVCLNRKANIVIP
jgi:hypothetical protein